MKAKILSTLLALSLFFISGCGGGGGSSNTHQGNPSTVSGFVQKGPFINGTSITMYELQENLVPTGKSYNSQINDTRKFSSLSFFFIEAYQSEADGFYCIKIL
jgi:hypothetical protein